ncbi:MAG: hypothetical protein AAGC93_29005 [Cyanobacteria bacterium P01_F01_bin.53]
MKRLYFVPDKDAIAFIKRHGGVFKQKNSFEQRTQSKKKEPQALLDLIVQKRKKRELTMTHEHYHELTPAAVKQGWESGEYTAKGYLYHLYLVHRQADKRWQIGNVAAFCKEWGIGRSTFYRAKAALIKDGLLRSTRNSTIVLKLTTVPTGAEPLPLMAETLAKTIDTPMIQDSASDNAAL